MKLVTLKRSVRSVQAEELPWLLHEKRPFANASAKNPMMRSTSLLLLTLTTILLAIACTGLFAQEEKKEQPKKNLMTLKLEHAQKVLAAVAQTDYSKVESNAQQLIRISKELGWTKSRSERYDELSKEYRHELEGLIKAARMKNNEALALSYVKVSLACFNCHNHVREIKIANGDYAK